MSTRRARLLRVVLLSALLAALGGCRAEKPRLPELESPHGDPVPLGGPGAKVYALLVLRADHEPAVRMARELTSLQRALGPETLSVVAALVEPTDTEQAADFVRRNRLDLPVAMGTPGLLEALGSPGVLPVLCLLDPELHVLVQWQGYVDRNTVQRKVEELAGASPP